MKRTRWILVFAILAAILATGFVCWVKPVKVDMARYAPADSLLYLESNRPLDVIEAIRGTDAWNTLEKLTGNQRSPARNHWFQRFVGWTGIGPIQTVILARAQVAAVVTELGTAEEGDTLRIKPQWAVLIDTHTTERRIRPPVEQAVKRLGEIAYGLPTFRKTNIDGFEFVEWIAPEGSRQIVATIVGSLVIVGNGEQVVRNCLAVSLGQRPSLKDDPGLTRIRLQLAGDRALTFGYVPPGNSARLLSVGVPLLLGRAPSDSEFQHLITTNAPKVLGSIGWSSQSFMTGIEDRYLISLPPAIVTQLKPNFGFAKTSHQIQRLLPDNVYSVTCYRFENPKAAWQSLKTAVSSQVDALSAVVFSSLLKAALLPYGIDEPERFLEAVEGDLLTLRLDQNSGRSMLIARVRDRTALRALITRKMGIVRTGPAGNVEIFEDAQGETAGSFVDEFVVMGSPTDVRQYVKKESTQGMMLSEGTMRRMTFFLPTSSLANVITYTDDSDRIRSFFSAVLELRGGPPIASERLAPVVAALPYSTTETTLGERGLERITRSPLGQFSTLLPLLVPEQLTATKTSSVSQ